MTHAARALQSHDLSGEGINLWITRTWKASPDEWSAQCRGHLVHNTNIKDDTHQAYTQSLQQGEYEMMIMAARWYSGSFVGLTFPGICLTGEEKNPKKTSPRKPVPAWDRTQARMLPPVLQRWTIKLMLMKEHLYSQGNKVHKVSTGRKVKGGCHVSPTIPTFIINCHSQFFYNKPL